MEINLVKLVKHDLTADEYLWLYQKYYETDIPIKYVLDKEKLQRNGWVKVLPDQIVLRHKTRNLFEEGDYVHSEEQTRPTAVTINGELNKVKDWIQEYRELFPAKTPSGRLLRGTPSGCIKKMQTFVKQNSSRDNIITKEVVINATKEYLKGQAREGYMYTKAANYFILKDQDSLLLQHIEILKDNNNQSLVSDGTSNFTDDI
jgi:hypothetical protein